MEGPEQQALLEEMARLEPPEYQAEMVEQEQLVHLAETATQVQPEHQDRMDVQDQLEPQVVQVPQGPLERLV
jgi:hypothetical protein